MKITISRHAKRRMKLYSIEENDINFLLNHSSKTKFVGRHEIIAKLEKFSYPLKAIIDVREKDIFIITCYPLKRARNEN